MRFSSTTENNSRNGRNESTTNPKIVNKNEIKGKRVENYVYFFIFFLFYSLIMNTLCPILVISEILSLKPKRFCAQMISKLTRTRLGQYRARRISPQKSTGLGDRRRVCIRGNSGNCSGPLEIRVR